MQTEYNVFEDNAGGLHLVISNENGEDVYSCFFSADHGELKTLRALVRDLDATDVTTEEIDEWEGNTMDNYSTSYDTNALELVWCNGRPKNEARWGRSAQFAFGGPDAG